jgi:hypothetical protein
MMTFEPAARTCKPRSSEGAGDPRRNHIRHRFRMHSQGLPADLIDRRPVIGICNARPHLTPCNARPGEAWGAGGLGRAAGGPAAMQREKRCGPLR